MIKRIKAFLKLQVKKCILRAYPELSALESEGRHIIATNYDPKRCGKYVKIYGPALIYDTTIGDYTYVAQNSHINMATIGKCCSIGPNLICGWGIHPLDGISTHPMFYSTMRQNGMTLASSTKLTERKPISIGNDVFIGANVTILDGVTIGDGAIIGAGAVVSKDIPPYAIAVGNPIAIRCYRFPEEIQEKLQQIKWWDFTEEQLVDVEKMFFNVEDFIQKYV